MQHSIGFIGVGNMGTAILKGLTSRDDIELHGFDLHTDSLVRASKEYGFVAHTSARDLVLSCDYIIVAVKPQHAEPVLKEIVDALDTSKCLISICAGLALSQFEQWTENRCAVVRVMPNTPALVNQGVSAICLDNANLSKTMKEFVPALFQGIGQVHVLPEKQFDAFTGVIGSGPAYVFYFMEAMIESGVALGLTRVQATEMVEGLFLGSSKLAAESDLPITQLREMVTSPAGTTVQALMHFDRQAVRGDIIDGVFEAYHRSIELGKK
ncbi:pyrroline-5-carboxylate reductase [Pseudodesulfovibrio sp. JC047]|uniref:pyrroline-5-carboxylate reductase n=1 Tax=Pseudodesulfovibrio sp. JC047 TaxID=2683199 RepID=UPI0013CF405B|nr:pyrroline-5-carboxylate reductase [Pseudodesulfovibrio sp. JC047]NDV19170.1 pyrroline-5-carboxylate reductase [Pseudodesulfovibrio sp. JC047]